MTTKGNRQRGRRPGIDANMIVDRARGQVAIIRWTPSDVEYVGDMARGETGA